jgi:hypothetical protein
MTSASVAASSTMPDTRVNLSTSDWVDVNPGVEEDHYQVIDAVNILKKFSLKRQAEVERLSSALTQRDKSKQLEIDHFRASLFRGRSSFESNARRRRISDDAIRS